MPGRGGSGRIERVAVISMHTCPLDQPGIGDSGGMNVAVRSTAWRLAEMGVQVDLFTRAAGPEQHIVDVDPGVRVVHLEAGPDAPIAKEELPSYLWPFLCGLLRFEADEADRLGIEGPIYDLVHSHYWLSGWAGRLARERLGIPLVHSFHTLGAVKNRALTPGDTPEPAWRLRGEEKIVHTADRLIAPTGEEANDLVSLYGASADAVRIVAPGVDTDRFRPGVPAAAKAAVGLEGRRVLLFVGRLQPLKRPDVAVRAVADLVARRPELAGNLTLVVIGGPSGAGGISAESLRALAGSLGISAHVDVRDPVAHALLPDYYRAADVVIMPSATESFGLVALEAQACGTPVVATDAGGLRAAVRNGTTGMLIASDDPGAYGAAVARLLDDRSLRASMGAAAARHARGMDWRRSASALLNVYQELLTDDRQVAVPHPTV